MKLIRHTAAELVFKDPPGCIWLFGLFFSVISGIFIAGLSGLFNMDEINGFEQAGAWIISLAGFSAGIWIIYSYPGITVDFNKRKESVIIKRRGLFRNESEKFSFNQIKKIDLSISRDSDGDPIYYIILELNTNEKIRLNMLAHYEMDDLQKLIRLMNNFILN